MKIKIIKKLKLNEARSGDREAGVIVKSVIDFLALMIKAQHKEIISRKDQVPDGDPGGELTAENFGPSFYSEKNFNNFMKRRLKKLKNSKYLKLIKNYKLTFKELSGGNKNKFVLKSPGAGWMPGKQTLKIDFEHTIGWDKTSEKQIKGSDNKRSVNNNLGVLNKIKITLQENVRHEIEHSLQNIKGSGFDKTIDLYDKIIKEKDPSKRLKMLNNTTKSIGKKITDFFYNLVTKKEKESYKEQYDKILKESVEDFKKLLKAYSASTEAQKYVLYYLQPVEIEAYAVGFTRKATLLADKELVILRKSGKKVNRKDLIKKHFSSRLDDYINMMNDHNDDLFMKLANLGIDEVNLEESWTTASNLISKFESNIINYVDKRYGFLK
tara:strand:+ start:1291 stop:2436 length:1146 start_codon:yes stop_codon:yes gene_type:complete